MLSKFYETDLVYFSVSIMPLVTKRFKVNNTSVIDIRAINENGIREIVMKIPEKFGGTAILMNRDHPVAGLESPDQNCITWKAQG